MKTRTLYNRLHQHGLRIVKNITVLVILLFICSRTVAQEIQLPQPRNTGGMPLMDAINQRQSTRDFSSTEIPQQVLSDLLWAAYGFNRPEKQGRTVPSAWNIQNMSVYVATGDGLFLYDAGNHNLITILTEDIRAQTGTQSYVKDVPVNLVYVADMSMMAGVGEKGDFYSNAHAGFISQNVYLVCASLGLGSVVRDLIDRDTLRKTMQLENSFEIILAQSVGYPSGTSEVRDKKSEQKDSKSASLSLNFPNPFNPVTEIRYKLSRTSQVRLEVYDVRGAKMSTLVDEEQSAGEHTVVYNGGNLTSGLYFYKITTDEYAEMRKMMLVK